MKKTSTKEKILKPIAVKFKMAMTTLIELGDAKDRIDFGEKIGIDNTIISRLLSGERQLKLEYVENIIARYNLNSEYFFKNEKNLFSRDNQKQVAESRSYGNTTTQGANSPVINGDNHGVVKARYEQIAEHIYNEAPPELKEQLDTLVSTTRDIKKMNDGYELENGDLKQKIGVLESKLTTTSEELILAKDELLEMYREIRKK
jgi:transcriptional regulator with XRE-family HTH domain